MALPEETPRVLHNGNGTRGPFSLSVGGTPISFADGSQIVVTRYDSLGVGTLQVEGTHYELSAETALPDMGDANRPIATATLSFKLAQPVLAVGQKVLIERVSTVEQALVLNVGGGFSAPANERNLDAIIRISQELANKLDRVVTVNRLDPNGALELPAAADRADKILIFDGDGNLDVRDVGAGVGDMLADNNLSDLTNVTTARTNLGLGSAALLASSAVFQVANNLAEGNASSMRSNLGLGTLALLSVGDTISFTPTGATVPIQLANYAAYVIPFEAFGATGSGDQLAFLQAAYDALSTAGRGTLIGKPGRTYTISGRLRLKSNVETNLNGAVIQFTGVNDGIDADTNSILANGFVSASGISSYAGPAYKLNDADGFSRFSNRTTGLRDMWFIGPGAGASASGDGLYFDSSDDGITNIVSEGIFVTNFANNVTLNGHDGGWVNDNDFSRLFSYGADYHIRLLGTADGNQFSHYTIQPNTTANKGVRAIYCEGDNNSFSGSTWDWADAASTVAIELVGANNELNDFVEDQYVVERADNASGENDIEIRNGLRMRRNRGWYSPPSSGNPTFNGRDDILAWAHKRQGVTVSWTGPAVSSGSVDNVTKPGVDQAVWNALSTTPAVCTIDFGSTQTYLFAIGALFGFGKKADTVLYETSLNGSDWTTQLSVTGNLNHEVSICGKSWIAGTWRYLRASFSNPTGAEVQLQRLFAYAPSVSARVSVPVDQYNARGIVAGEQFVSLDADRTGTDDANPQTVFDLGLTLEANTAYKVEGYYWITRAAGTTSHTTGLLFDYTGTLENVNLLVMSANPTGNVLGAMSAKALIAKTLSAVTAANTSATENVFVHIKGTIRTLNAGIIEPQFQYSAAPGGAPTIKKDSYIRFTPIGDKDVVSSGPWS